MKTLYSILLIIAFHLPVLAHTTSTYIAEIGRASMLDTYLSPITYSGPTLALSGNWRHHTLHGIKDVDMVFNASLQGDIMTHPLTSRRMYYGGLNFGWGLTRAWSITPHFTLTAGGEAQLDAGCAFFTSNGNNPAAAKASIGLGFLTAANYHLRLGRLPVTIADNVRLPFLQLFFSQQYGETYYEIYLGNHSGLVHPGWWGNHFCIDNLLSATLHLGNHNLLLGYRFQTSTSSVNSITSRHPAHRFVIGLSI